MQWYTLVATLLAASTPPPLVSPARSLTTPQETHLYAQDPAHAFPKFKYSFTDQHLKFHPHSFPPPTMSELKDHCIAAFELFKQDGMSAPFSLSRHTLTSPARLCNERHQMHPDGTQHMAFLCTLAKIGHLILSVARRKPFTVLVVAMYRHKRVQ